MAAKSFEVDIEVKTSGLFESISGFKYAFHEAMGDLIDNAVDAGAKNVWVVANKDHITIADDGNGMDTDAVKRAITPWATARDMRIAKRGKYGIGLKAAGFSLGQYVEIHSKTKKDLFHFILLDREKLREKDDTRFKGSHEVTKTWNDFKLKHGTIINIREVNTRKVTDPNLDALKGKLGVMFFELIESGDLTITVNNSAVEALDPLLPGMKKNKGNWYHHLGKRTIKFKDKNGVVHPFEVEAAYVGRGNFWSDLEKKKYRFFLKRSSTNGAQLKLDDQGLYVSRNGRLITLGGWWGTASANTLLHHNAPCRVIVRIPPGADEIVGVDHTKTKPDFAPEFRDKLREEFLKDIISQAETYFRKEGGAIQKSKQKQYEIETRARIKSAPMAMAHPKHALEEAERVSKSNPKIEALRQETESFVSKLVEADDRFFMLVQRLPSGVLWDTKVNKDKKVTVLLNERHPGYAALFFEHDEQTRNINLNLFFYFLAKFENFAEELADISDPKVKKELKNLFQKFRKYVSDAMRNFEGDSIEL